MAANSKHVKSRRRHYVAFLPNNPSQVGAQPPATLTHGGSMSNQAQPNTTPQSSVVAQFLLDPQVKAELASLMHGAVATAVTSNTVAAAMVEASAQGVMTAVSTPACAAELQKNMKAAAVESRAWYEPSDVLKTAISVAAIAGGGYAVYKGYQALANQQRTLNALTGTVGALGISGVREDGKVIASNLVLEG